GGPSAPRRPAPTPATSARSRTPRHSRRSRWPSRNGAEGPSRDREAAVGRGHARAPHAEGPRSPNGTSQPLGVCATFCAVDVLLRTDDGAVCTLTLNRPEARNALDLALVSALRREVAAAAADPSVRCIVLAGAGKAFCAGADVKAWS